MIDLHGPPQTQQPPAIAVVALAPPAAECGSFECLQIAAREYARSNTDFESVSFCGALVSMIVTITIQ